jgi:hypothetical protein
VDGIGLKAEEPARKQRSLDDALYLSSTRLPPLENASLPRSGALMVVPGGAPTRMNIEPRIPNE